MGIEYVNPNTGSKSKLPPKHLPRPEHAPKQKQYKKQTPKHKHRHKIMKFRFRCLRAAVPTSSSQEFFSKPKRVFGMNARKSEAVSWLTKNQLKTEHANDTAIMARWPHQRRLLWWCEPGGAVYRVQSRLLDSGPNPNDDWKPVKPAWKEHANDSHQATETVAPCSAWVLPTSLSSPWETLDGWSSAPLRMR